MKPIVELQRRTTPFPKPQALFVDGHTLWVSSRTTKHLYALERDSFAVTWDTSVPDGMTPWGVTKVERDLFTVCGTDASEVDDRVIRRVVPRYGVDPDFRWACPEGMGSHLSHTGAALVLSQWYPKKLIVFDVAGVPVRTIEVGHGVVGHCFAQGAFYLATTDAEETDEYWLSRLDPTTGRVEHLARIGFPARALAFDGTHFWTNHREADQIVRFSPG